MTVLQPHLCRTDPEAHHIDGDGFPRRARSNTAGNRQSAGSGIARHIVPGGLGRPLASCRDVSCASTLPATTARMVGRLAQSP